MRILWSLPLLAMCSLAIGDTRGLKIRVKDPQGQAIELYSESHALLIGASRYQDPGWPSIESIPGELKKVEEILKAQGFSVQTHLDPTKRQLKDHFADFIDQYGYDENNRLLFFFAGHGYTRKDGNKGYLVPVDAPNPLEDEKGFQRKALPMSQILAWARQTEAKHSLFLFDSCFSGTIFKSRALPEHPPAISTAVSRPVRQFITAGSAGQTVPAKSTFTPAFVEALQYGKGDLNQDGYVSGTELGLYLQQEVPQYVDQTPQFGKITDYELSRGDFVFVLPGTKVAKAAEPVEAVSEKTVSVDPKAIELEFWQSIKDSDDPFMYQAHLDLFPDGTFSSLAKQKLKQIAAAEQAAELEKQRRQDRLKREQPERERKEAEQKEQELSFWQTIKDSDEPEMFREYLLQFPAGVYSGLAKIKIRLLEGDPSGVPSSIPDLDYGDYYALVIGNNEYQNLPNLRSAVNDAKAVSTVLEVDYGFNVKLLEDASRSEILRSLKHLRETARSEDNVLIYYAGHGHLDREENEGYWLPVDADRDDPTNWILTDRITSQVKAMKAKHVMVVVDSCFSGTITRAIKIEQRTPEWLSEIVRKKARTALTSGGIEPVMDSGSGNHSAFAHAFISLLEENDGVLDASQLFSKLRPKVMVNSTQTPQYGKIHMAGDDGGDFLFVRQ